MKKLFILFAVAALMLGFASCSSDGCKCTVLGQTEEITQEELDESGMSCKDHDVIASLVGGSCK